jgi:hypothetical protein
LWASFGTSTSNDGQFLFLADRPLGYFFESSTRNRDAQTGRGNIVHLHIASVFRDSIFPLANRCSIHPHNRRDLLASPRLGTLVASSRVKENSTA